MRGFDARRLLCLGGCMIIRLGSGYDPRPKLLGRVALCSLKRGEDTSGKGFLIIANGVDISISCNRNLASQSLYHACVQVPVWNSPSLLLFVCVHNRKLSQTAQAGLAESNLPLVVSGPAQARRISSLSRAEQVQAFGLHGFNRAATRSSSGGRF